jgi:hypothetical protein
MSKKTKKKVYRVGVQPPLKAQTFGDRRTKRNRTRADQKRRWIAE